LQAQRTLYEASLGTLRDVASTTVVLVSRPEPSSLTEAERTHRELREAGLSNHILILNGVFTARASDDPSAMALQNRGRSAIENMPQGLAQLHRLEVPLLPFAPIGIGNLRSVLGPARSACTNPQLFTESDIDLPPLGALVEDLEKGGHGVILTMGKGGVGKTTIAAAIAVELAHRGHRVHLSTTDPAAHVAQAVRDQVPNLTISKIDPEVETRRYTSIYG
jgi:arsenite-transporting ATPase